MSNTIRLADSVGTGSSPVGASADFKDGFDGWPCRGRHIVVVIDGHRDIINGLQALVSRVVIGFDVAVGDGR